MSFLPSDYKQPESESNYLKLEDGDNTFRVLSSAIVGWEWWEEKDNKRTPKRVKSQADMTPEQLDYVNTQYQITGREQLKHFWAFAVYNYAAKRIQILEVTQMTIMRGMQKYIGNEKWGDPKEYDFIISKEGEKLLTKYSVTVNPKEKLDADIVESYKKMNINLNALFSGQDPFKSEKLTEDLDINDIPDLG